MPKALLRINERGISIVEVLLAVSLFSIVAASLIGGLVYGQQSTAVAGNRARANLIAQEGLEAVKNIKDAGFSNLSDGTYGLIQSGGVWTLSGSSDITDIYTREIIISTVNVNRKNVTSRVSWTQGAQGSAQVEHTAQMSWWNNTFTKSWANAYLRHSQDASGTNGGVKVATSGNYAYMVRQDGTPDLIIIDITASYLVPSVVGSLSLTGSPTNIFVSGSYAYISSDADASELQIVNISNPASPSLTGTYNAAGTENGLGVFVVSTTVYLTRVDAGSNPDFLIINASNPASPSLSDSLNLNTTAYEPYVSGSLMSVVTADDSREFITINRAFLFNNLQVAASINLSGTNDAVAVAGSGTDLVIGQGTAVHTVSASSVTNPALQDSLTLSGTVQDVDRNTDDTFAFAGTDAASSEFQVINISSRSNITLSKTVDISGSSTLNGIAHNTTKDRVIGASSNSSQEVVVFSPN